MRSFLRTLIAWMLATFEQSAAPWAIAALWVIAASGCAGRVPQTTRVLGGRVQQGAFVSPHSYEWYIRGELFAAQGDHERAAEALQNARLGASDDAYVIARLATILEELGRTAAADRTIEEGLAFDSESEAVWLAKGHIALGRGRPDAARVAYERAAEVAPRSATAPLALAKLHAHEGRHRVGQMVLQTYLQGYVRRMRDEGSDFPFDSAQRGVSLIQVREAALELAVIRGDTELAAAIVRATLRATPGKLAMVRELARFSYDERPDITVALLEPIRRTPSDESLWVRALIQTGAIARARGVLEQTTAEDVGGPVKLAALYLSIDAPRAKQFAQQEPASQKAQWVIGNAELQSGRPGAAAEHFARALLIRHDRNPRLGLVDALRRQGLEPLAAEVLAHAYPSTGHSGSEPPRQPHQRGILERNQDLNNAVGLRIALAELRLTTLGLDAALHALSPERDVREAAARARLLDEGGRPRAAARAYAALPNRARPDNAHPDAGLLSPAVQARAAAERLLAAGSAAAASRRLRRWTRAHPDDLLARIRLVELLRIAGASGDAEKEARRLRPLTRSTALLSRLRGLGEPTSGPRTQPETTQPETTQPET